LPEDYQEHIIKTFNLRAKEMDNDLCRLALFLDLRFRTAACSTADGTVAGRLQVLGTLEARASSLAHRRGYSAEDLREMLMQMNSSVQGLPPFNLSHQLARRGSLSMRLAGSLH
jgi:hypothetical protein